MNDHKQITNPAMWFTRIQEMTMEFVQDDNELGVMMIDRYQQYWKEAYNSGASADDAFEALKMYLMTGK